MRSLTSSEINDLKLNGCTATDWSLISVAEPFRRDHYRNVSFSGKISLGTTEGQIERCGISFQCGIYNAAIHNCVIGDEVHIHGVADFIADYHIGDDCLIRNVNCIRCNHDAAFGVGTKVAVLNETGGREVPIYEGLSAHVAYLLAIYRHDNQLIDSLTKLIDKHREEVRADFGTISDRVTIVNAGTIIDVNIGPCATIDSATRLVNGTVASTGFAPVTIGTNVIAYDFIMQSGSEVTDGATLTHVFVGQGTRLSSYFTAHDSLFFANCTCENGEAAAIFAGPYTVTMHKSSLLIAGMFSFLNAGSGSNQSNHMYKLGPIHQGIVERGSKTTSDSYVLWPARIGAFSLVMGRHASNPDTSDLPFSYLIENHGITYVVPGANLRNVGTKRDEMKWPRRDRRHGVENGCGIDLIDFNILSPYTVEKMIAGNRLLKMIETENIAVDGVYTYRGLHIRTSSLRKGREYYSLAIDKFMGYAILRRIERCESRDDEAIRAILAPTTEAGRGSWADIAGLYAPKSEINALCHDISSGKFTNLSEINYRFVHLAADYNAMEWTWVAEQIEEWYGKPYEAFTSDDIIAIIDRWLEAELTIDKLLCDDAKKEFSELSRKGFGIDDPDCAEDDFQSVRGEFESNPFVTTVKEEMNRKKLFAADLKARFSFPRE